MAEEWRHAHEQPHQDERQKKHDDNLENVVPQKEWDPYMLGEPQQRQEEQHHEGDGEQEVRQPRPYKDSGQPSIKEVQDHNLTHILFRTWRKHCLRGRAKAAPHHKKEEDAHWIHSFDGLLLFGSS